MVNRDGWNIFEVLMMMLSFIIGIILSLTFVKYFIGDKKIKRSKR
jgi:hypothetical protein